MTRLVEPLGRRVRAIVNHDNFIIFPDVLDAYAAMVKHLEERHDSIVSRYTASSFLRSKLGDALQQHGLAPHIFERAEEARVQMDE